MPTSKKESSRKKGQGNDPKEGFRVTLPGKAYRRGNRWWWRVKLPGEDKARARALKAEGVKAATSDEAEAERIAFEMWEQAVWEQAQKKARIESSETIERLKAQFLDKVRHFTGIVQDATSKAEAEGQARAEAEARLEELTRHTQVKTQACECCGATDIPAVTLQRIDSGQLLCPACMAALHHDGARAEASDFIE